MAKIKFVCPACKKPAQIKLVMRWDAVETTILTEASLTAQEPKKRAKSQADAWFDDKPDPKEELQKDNGSIEQYHCSECGESLEDDKGEHIESENGLAKWLDSKGMLIRGPKDAKGPIANPTDSGRFGGGEDN